METTRKASAFSMICGDSNLSSKCHESIQLTVKTLNKFMKQIGVPSQEVSLCDCCYSMVDKAVEWRDQVGDIEQDMRSLQRIIVKMMRQLQTLQSNYMEEMGALEQKIGKSGTTRARATLPQGICDDGAATTEESNINASPKTSPQSSKICPTTEHVNVIEEPLLPPQQELESSSLSTENFDIEYAIYSENLVKCESLPVREDDNGLAHNVSTSLTSQTNKKKKTCGSKVKSRKRYGPCQYCGLTFESTRNLKDHVYTHTGERLYKCQLCPKAFRKTNNLHHCPRTYFAAQT